MFTGTRRRPGGGSRAAAGPGGPGVSGRLRPGQRGEPDQFGWGTPGDGRRPAAFGEDKKNLAVIMSARTSWPASQPRLRPRPAALPMAEVVGAFPLKAADRGVQDRPPRRERLQRRLPGDGGRQGQDQAGVPLPGLLVQRQDLRPRRQGDSRVSTARSGRTWTSRAPNSLYVATVAQVLKEFAPEDPKIAPLLIHGLYLPRPVQVPAKQGQTAVAKPYPDIEKELPKIQKTLEKMKEKEPTPAVAAQQVRRGDVQPLRRPGRRPRPRPSAAAACRPKAEDWAPPDYAVLRFLDLTIQPGQTYEYQVKVRMQNPNWNKPESEVANKQLTQKKELESEWYPVKGPDGEMLRVSVPTDLHLYAVDEQASRGGQGQEGLQGHERQRRLTTPHGRCPCRFTSGCTIYELSEQHDVLLPGRRLGRRRADLRHPRRAGRREEGADARADLVAGAEPVHPGGPPAGRPQRGRRPADRAGRLHRGPAGAAAGGLRRRQRDVPRTAPPRSPRTRTARRWKGPSRPRRPR